MRTHFMRAVGAVVAVAALAAFVYRFKMSKQPLSCGFMKQFTRPGGTR